VSFYLKKSLRFGPLRFNLSKSGIGVSAGVKGFRLGTGPRGNYIHAGRGGIYYRKTFSGRSVEKTRLHTSSVVPETSTPAPLEQPNELLTDASSRELVDDLNKRRKRLPTLLFCIVASAVGTAFAISNNAPFPLLAAIVVGAAWLCGASAIWDRDRKTTVLFYDIDSQVLVTFEALHSVFEQVQKCSRVSHIDSSEYYSDRKYHAGVLQGVGRSNGRPIPKHPPLVKTNVSIFTMPAGKLSLYFCPDRILVYGLKDIGAVAYSDLGLSLETCRFVESEQVFPDQQIVGHTWQYVNRDGGPDRRFRYNPQFPIVLYEELHIKSPGGLNEIFQFSKPGTAKQLAGTIRNLACALTNQPVELASPHQELPSVSLAPPLHVEGPQLLNVTPQNEDVDEELIRQCLEIIRQEKRASTSLLQRRLRLGYTRAARIVDILEQRGILGPGEGAKPREILVDLDAAV